MRCSMKKEMRKNIAFIHHESQVEKALTFTWLQGSRVLVVASYYLVTVCHGWLVPWILLPLPASRLLTKSNGHQGKAAWLLSDPHL